MSNRATTNILFFSIILLVVSLVIAGYTWYSLEKKGANLINDLQSVRDQEILQTEFGKMKSILDDTEESRKKLNDLVIDGDDGAVSLLSVVDQLAKDLKVSLLTKELNVVKSSEVGFDELVVEFSASGDSRSVMKLIQLFELIPYHSRVVRLSLSRKADSDTGVEQTDANITLHLSIKESKL
jgi:hypothetical protein